VPAVEIEFYRPDAFSEAGGAFGFVENPAVWQYREYAVLLVGDGIAYRLAVCPDDAWHLDARGTLGQIPVKGNRSKLRILDGLDDNREDLEHRAGLLVRARQDVEQRVLLSIVRTLVDDRVHDALTMVDRPRKVEGRHNRQAIESIGG